MAARYRPWPPPRASCCGCRESCPAGPWTSRPRARFKIADKVLQFLGLLADLGYIGPHPDIITGYKRKRGEKTLSEAKKAANRARANRVQASLRCLGEPT